MGIDSRIEFYRAAILKEGIATFEVDFKSGIYSSPLNRPHPSAFVPMVFAALKELRKLPSIDPDRIGVMGYSLGGHMAVDAAFEANRKPWMGDEKGFAAHVAFYPAFKRLLHEKANFEVATVEYAGALHAFNRNAPPEDHWDPVAIGHRSHTAWNADAANDSLGQVVSFLRKTLTAK